MFCSQSVPPALKWNISFYMKIWCMSAFNEQRNEEQAAALSSGVQKSFVLT